MFVVLQETSVAIIMEIKNATLILFIGPTCKNKHFLQIYRNFVEFILSLIYSICKHFIVRY
ncbi:hypothetical protein KL86CLO1_11953 [uncultured Eubacteriales bacterium]|uniref:Uncharacterized protein n=1 Tax=uncultured Eubacteriales bacterium TaxID=172733 RepID=A0A212JZB9_9FIRM|nr:hypothetical protein KL86CLO1_11953 [uncultured Eubacteriales bacterium]